MAEAYTPEEARSPSYWRGRAEACLEAMRDAAWMTARARSALIGQAAMYERIADGLERSMVDVAELMNNEEPP